MKNPNLALVALCAIASGCVSPAVHKDSFATVDFTRFHSVAYVVHDTPSTEYADGDKGYGKDAIQLFETLLGQRLAKIGYTVVNADANPDLAIDVAVNAAKPGSAAARFWVGFGAGRAVFTFTANFTADSKAVAAFDGGQSHIGMEPGKAFANEQEIQTFAAMESVKQVEIFIKNGGRFPPTPQAAPRR